MKGNLSRGMSAEEKVKEQNRIRQLAFKAREKMPKDHKSFCLVAAHLIRNAHRYFISEEIDPDIKKELDVEIKKENKSEYGSQMKIENSDEECREVNKVLRQIRTLKRQNRIREQQMLIEKLKSQQGSYRKIAKITGIALKTVHEWCAEPKSREHRGTIRKNLKQEAFINFVMQDTVTYSHPCKRYSGKRFLMGTLEETYQKYLQQPAYHKNGILSRTRMRMLKPKYILLSGQIPLNQCLCDYCENCDLMLKALVAAGVKGVPRNKYSAIDITLCDIRLGQFGTDYEFCSHTCISRGCNQCGTDKLKIVITDLNSELLKLNKPISWHKWMKVDGKAHKKCPIKKPLKTAINEFMGIIHNLSEHLFRANWHRNVFQFIKSTLSSTRGYLLQVMDFAMNFSNWYQDEIQSAYWNGTQTTIHGTINFFKCPREECSEVVTLALVHISADTNHDSFLTRAAQNMTFKYLVDIGVPLELIIQFCDNCSSQYKSSRPFAELARCALEIIRIYFGEKHGKSHADALFGRLKAWMSYKIKSRHFVVSDAHDFFKYCVEYYQTPKNLSNSCQHYRVEFQFIRPSDIRRHQDCDLETRVEETQKIYSVRNTSQPLQLKVRHVPCLCLPCIKDDGSECLNEGFTDPWRLVNLIPQKGSSLKKYAKRKRPDADIVAAPTTTDEVESDGELPDISFDYDKNKPKSTGKRNARKTAQKKSTRKENNIVTEESGNCQNTCTWVNENEEIEIEDVTPVETPARQGENSGSPESEECEIVEVCECRSKEFLMSAENHIPTSVNSEDIFKKLFDEKVPESVFWPNILLALENCRCDDELLKLCQQIHGYLPSLKPRVNAEFVRGNDIIDRVAQSDIPVDGPEMLVAVKTIGDGNCLCRAISRGLYNQDSFHVELRARIVVEGVLNRNLYLSDDCLERGATCIHKNADLPTVFATFSEYYTPGQKLSTEMISNIYSLEIHSCARIGSYMGLWQLAQASSVIGIPIHTIYPHRPGTIRNDFHRIFFPVDYPVTTSDDNPLVIMWTGIHQGSVPVHFVPLLKNPQ